MAYIIYIYSEKLSVDLKLDSVSCSSNCISLLEILKKILSNSDGPLIFEKNHTDSREF